MKSLKIDLKAYRVINIGIFAPSLIMFYYVIKNVYPYMNAYFFIFLAVLPFVRLAISRKYKSFVYVAALLIILISILISLSIQLGYISDKYGFLAVKPNLDLMVAAITGIGFITMIEGIVSEKLYANITLLAFSVLTFLDMIAAIIVFRETGYSFSTSYFYVEMMEYYAIYSLVVYGYETTLPLATFTVPIWQYIMAGFIVSIISIFSMIFLKTRKEGSRVDALSYTIFYGSILGVASFYFIETLQKFSLQFFAIAAVVVAMVIAIQKTGKKEKASNKS
ncbi:MAG: hypothetical protein ACP5UV_01845 [Thermoplasmata archaeon]